MPFLKDTFSYAIERPLKRREEYRMHPSNVVLTPEAKYKIMNYINTLNNAFSNYDQKRIMAEEELETTIKM